MLQLTEKPTFFQKVSNDKLIIFFPSRPFWFVANNDYRVLLSALNGSESVTDACKRLIDMLCIPSNDNNAESDFQKVMIETINYLGKAGVLYKDGKPLYPISDNEPKEQIAEVEAVLVLAFTYRCNLSCPHCYADAGKNNLKEMSTKQIYKIISDLDELSWNPSISNIGLIGGEPFLRKDIFKIMDCICDKGYGLVISTNALLLNGDTIHNLSRYPRLKVSVSLDGSTADTHEIIRGKNTFEKTISSIRLLVKNNISTGINIFVHKDNLHEMSSILRLAKDLGVDSVNANTLMYVGRGKKQLIEPVSRKELFRAIFEVANRDPAIETLIENSTFANKLVALAAGFKTNYCGVGSNRAIYVRADGNLYPCGDTALSEFYLGNLKKSNIAKIWRESPLLEKLRQTSVDTLNDQCASCIFRYYCGGDCRGENYHITNDYNSPHFKCNQIKEALIDMMWMLAEKPDFLKSKIARIKERALHASIKQV